MADLIAQRVVNFSRYSSAIGVPVFGYALDKHYRPILGMVAEKTALT